MILNRESDESPDGACKINARRGMQLTKEVINREVSSIGSDTNSGDKEGKEREGKKEVAARDFNSNVFYVRG